MEIDSINQWVEGYIKAWNSNDPEDIGRLFSDNAKYYTAPFRRPWTGRHGIISGWLDRKDEPDDFEFRYEVLGVSQKKGFVRGWTKYIKGNRDYSNLWVIQLDDENRCDEFIEWWMQDK
jgi:hypothetical protein